MAKWESSGIYKYKAQAESAADYWANQGYSVHVRKVIGGWKWYRRKKRIS